MHAIPITTGTKTALIRSARSWIFGIHLARFTRSIIFDNTESFAAAVTCAFRLPSSNMDPLMTRSFVFYLPQAFTGDNGFIYLTPPHSIFASAGTCSPLRIRTRSPLRNCILSTGKIISWCWSSKAIILAVTFCVLTNRVSAFWVV